MNRTSLPESPSVPDAEAVPPRSETGYALEYTPEGFSRRPSSAVPRRDPLGARPGAELTPPSVKALAAPLPRPVAGPELTPPSVKALAAPLPRPVAGPELTPPSVKALAAPLPRPVAGPEPPPPVPPPFSSAEPRIAWFPCPGPP